jgi:hypothetical protein
MNVSFNELKSMSKGAARGAGFDWGYAEEISFAVVWLAKNGYNSATTLLTFLDNKTIYPPTNINENIWTNDKGDLDPIKTGVALLDLNISKTIVLKGIFLPLLIVPFVSQLKNVMLLEGNNLKLVAENDFFDSKVKYLPARADVLKISSTQGTQVFNQIGEYPLTKRCEVDNDVWNRLKEFTYRTYAPVTDESRMLGAGSGLSDND